MYEPDSVDKALNRVLNSFNFFVGVKRDNRAHRLTFRLSGPSNCGAVAAVADKTYNKFGKDFKLVYEVWAADGLSAFRVRRDLVGVLEKVKFKVCECPGHLLITRGRGKHQAKVATVID